MHAFISWQHSWSKFGEIPVNILKKSNFSFDELTICVNHALINGKFWSIFKNAVTLVHKKDDDPADKTNFSPLSSKVFEQIQYNQLDKYVGTFLNKIFS